MNVATVRPHRATRAEWARLRAALWDRARGRCEFCRHPFPADASGVEVHHRKMRSQGGADEMVNLALVHTACHAWTHQHPQAAYERGWLVPSWADSAEVPVQTRA